MTQKITVVVPGTTGSILVLPIGNGGAEELIWPNGAIANPNNLVNLLTQPGIIAKSISSGYFTLMEGIAKKTTNPNSAIQILANPQLIASGNFLPNTSSDVIIGFGYDWRIKIETSAAVLANLLTQIYNTYGSNSELYIVAHSMGGLISRYVWEGGLAPANLQGFASIFKSLTTLGTPHTGAPLALAAITNELPSALLSLFGLNGSLVQSFIDNPGFPSTYELLPPPTTCFLNDNTSIYSTGKPTAYDTLTNPSTYKGSVANMATAASFWGTLSSPQNYWMNNLNLAWGTGTDLPTLEGMTYIAGPSSSTGKFSDGVLDYGFTGDTIVPSSSASFTEISTNKTFTGSMQAFPGVDHDSLPSNSNVIAYVAALIYP